MTFSYSITFSSFQGIQKNDAETLENLKQLGINHVEMFGEPDSIDWNYYKNLFESYAIKTVGVTGMWGRSSPNGWRRRLLSKDISFLKYASSYVLKCIELCRYIGATKFNVCLFSDPITSFDVTHKDILKDSKVKILKKYVPDLRKLSKIATDNGVDLMIEPLNRYSTPLCCSYEDSLVILNEITEMKLMLDTFHMNIEEDSISTTILNSKKNRLSHMHFADNNRKMPGFGHIDFEAIIKSLKGISYKEVISFEPTLSKIDYFSDLKHGLDYIKKIDLKY